MQFVQAPTLPLLSGSWLDSLQIFLVISSAMSLTLICTPIWRGTERSKLRYQAGKTGLLACFRRSDSHGARPKSESRKKEGRREGEGGGGGVPASFCENMHHSMLPLIMSCTRSWNFAWHLLWRSTTDENIVKLLAISQTIHTVCCEDDYFPKGKF